MIDAKAIQNIKPDAFYTAKEVRELLGVTKHAVQAWIKRGKIERIKIAGRVYIKGEDILNLIKRG